MTQTEINMLAAAGLSPTGGAFDYRSLLEPTADTTAGGIAAGNPPKSGYGAYGGIPQLPPYTIDTTTTTGADYWAQLMNAGGAGVGTNLRNSVGAIGSHIAGQITPTTMADIERYAAMTGSGMGMGADSPGTNTAALQLIGRKAEDLTKQGLAEQSQLWTTYPYQQSNTTTQKTDLSALQSIYNAMPDPALAAQESLNAIAAGMGRGGYGSSGGLRIPTASDVRPTDMSWFYKQPGGGGGGSAPSLSGGWNLPGSTYDPYGVGEPFEGDISDPNSAWWQDYGGTGNLGDMGFGGWYDTGSSWDDWSDYEGDYGWI